MLLTDVVGPNLQSLVLAHQQANLLVFLVLQHLDQAHATLLPLVASSLKAVELALAADAH